MMRYYGEEQAKKEVERAKGYKRNSEIYNCLFFLTDFVYEKIAFKRLQAIRDMEDLYPLTGVP
ncbi:MAG: hypothetical protein IJU76_15245, partial [Desulfovibrionaceae bacterium]|nr:hypothetical protein [Desulfovibrionaceae bacterium]